MAQRQKTGNPDEERYFMSGVKLGPKGQIVIPKEVREMFAIKPGDQLVLLADRERGIALQRSGELEPFLRKAFESMHGEEEESE